MTNALVQTRIDPEIRDRAANEGALPIELLSDPAVHDAWFRAKVREALEDVRDHVEDGAVADIFAQHRAAALTKDTGR